MGDKPPAYLMDALAQNGYPCQKNTLITLLRRLIAKGFLSSHKIGRMNEYEALVTSDAYRTNQVRGFVDKYYEGQAGDLVTALIRADLLSADDWEELRQAAKEAGDS